MQLSEGEEAMGLSFYAVGEHLEGLLADAGYTFHEGDDGAGRYGYWFCWTDGKCDIETGETRDERLGALMDAADHWFTHARIPTDTDDDGCPVGELDKDGDLSFVVDVEGQPRRWFANVHDAMHYAQGAVYAGPTAASAALSALQNGREAGWCYGFTSVSLYPPRGLR